MTVIGALSSFRKRGEMSPHKRARARQCTCRHSPRLTGLPACGAQASSNPRAVANRSRNPRRICGKRYSVCATAESDKSHPVTL